MPKTEKTWLALYVETQELFEQAKRLLAELQETLKTEN